MLCRHSDYCQGHQTYPYNPLMFIVMVHGSSVTRNKKPWKAWMSYLDKNTIKLPCYDERIRMNNPGGKNKQKAK